VQIMNCTVNVPVVRGANLDQLVLQNSYGLGLSNVRLTPFRPSDMGNCILTTPTCNKKCEL